VSADVTWEHHRRAPQTVFFESSDPEAGLEPNPHAFVAAAAAPALARGERRIRVQGSLSPRFRDGLATVFETLVRWHRPKRRPVRLEATDGYAPTSPSPGARAALMLSGGLDSLALLRKNREDFPLDHPRSHARGFFVHGFDIPEDADLSARRYERALAGLAAAAEDAALGLVPVRTNLRSLGSRWPEEHQSGGCAAVAHACADRVRAIEIAASYTWRTLFPYGSHPSLDLHYGSDDVTIRHADAGRGRVEKMRMLAAWPAGLAALRVCWEGEPPDEFLNCGACHKCVLTMLELLAAGRQEMRPVFPVDEVTAEHAERLKAHQRSSIPFFTELVDPLEAEGRADLAAVVRRKLRQIDTHLAVRARVPRWKRLLPLRGV
jgi:hypothetical protein